MNTHEKYAYMVLNRCIGHYGTSKFQKGEFPILEFIENREEILSGEYIWDHNSIVLYNLNDIVKVYPNAWREHVARTVLHEYCHYLQSPVWMERYGKMYDYYDNPYEKEAYEFEEDWAKVLTI